MGSSKQHLSVDFETTRYQAAYQSVGQGQPLLFLHGFMGSSECWRSLLPYLHPYYRCISLDLLGFGDSSKPTIRYDIAQQVRFVQQFIAALNLPSCVLVGHSLGGWVAAATALAHSAAVSGLVLVGPAGIRDDSFCGRYEGLRPLLWPTPVIDVGLWLARPLAALVGQKARLDRLSWFRQEINAQPAARSFLVDRMHPEDATDTVERDIHRLRLPTLIIAGDRDETIPLWHCQTYAQKIPGAHLCVVPHADHSLPQHHAAEIAALMLPFLQIDATQAAAAK